MFYKWARFTPLASSRSTSANKRPLRHNPSPLINPPSAGFLISKVDVSPSENLPIHPFPSRHPSAGTMSRTKQLLSLFALFGLATFAHASEGGGVAPAAAKLIDFGNGWAITNSMATGWAVSALFVAVIIFFLRKPQVLPTKSQSVFESLLEALRDLFEPIVGKKAFPATFPL